MTRRRFAFWLGFGLFSLAEKLHANGLDALAAAAMRGTEPPATMPPESPEHWTAAGDKTWRWYERETWIEGQWKLTGTTVPINKTTGRRKVGRTSYLDDGLVPDDVRIGGQKNIDPITEAEPTVELVDRQPSAARRARHGRPPSKWLRSLHADEIRIWLKTIEVPEAGVSGMTYWVHLTRDHSFDPEKIAGLTVEEQAKLHAAAHFGY